MIVDILGIERGRITQTNVAEVGRILARAGWECRRPGARGESRKRVWVRPPRPADAEAGKAQGGRDDDAF